MKNKLLPLLVLICFHNFAFSQSQYEISDDTKHPGTKVLKGIINKNLLSSDTAFKWYAESRKIYNNPDTAVTGAFERNRKTASFVIFGGTWCDDTQFILPKFFKLQEITAFPDDRITFFGVNRDKQTLGNIAAAMNITNVPTIIVMKNGIEVGRVVEYGKTGKWDKELADILNSPLK
ncbi:MAG: thioredoxin family protein [Chitinophagaceae bacterium]|nr:thioredoxin family protein [Chitinophagaceae bacterium]